MTDIEKDGLMAERIAENVSECGGRTFFVGGCVRDEILGEKVKDYDIEVHGITPDCLEKILDSLGERISIGESFGIYNIKGCSIDIAMPRKEKVRGLGHKDFDVFVDPFIGTEGASKRRDFTINALMKDVLTGEIIDHYNGRRDLELRILRHVNDESFGEDPLRVLRGAQFAARLGAKVAPETVSICCNMKLTELSRERVEGELRKALLKAERPSVFFEVLREMNQLDFWFPELSSLCNVPQNPKHHAEGDVWTHTMMVIDEAAKHRFEVSNPFGFMLAAVAHDFGKAICTEVINGAVHAYEHETKGLPLIESFLRRITSETKLIEYVMNICELHMQPNVVAGVKASVKSTNRMFDRAVDPVALICFSVADSEGKIPPREDASNEEFLYERLDIYREYMSRPYVMGRDLIEAGLSPGENFSEILSYAHKLRLAGVEKKSALKQVLAFAGKNLEKTNKLW